MASKSLTKSCSKTANAPTRPSRSINFATVSEERSAIGAETAARSVLGAPPRTDDAGQEAPSSRQHQAAQFADRLWLCDQKSATKRLICFHVGRLQDQLKEHLVAEEAAEMLGACVLVIIGGANYDILEWHLNYVQGLAGDLPGIPPILGVLSHLISHAKSIGL